MSDEKSDAFWMDSYLALQQEQNQKQNTINITNTLIDQQKILKQNKNKKILLPFKDRFKNKCWAFNKNGDIRKIQDNSQQKNMKNSIILKIKKTIKTEGKQNIDKPKIKIINPNKIIQLISKNTEIGKISNSSSRIISSVESSQVIQNEPKNKNHRYQAQWFSIPEQQVEQTAIKKPKKNKRIYTSVGERLKFDQIKKSVFFQDENNMKPKPGSDCQDNNNSKRLNSLDSFEKQKIYMSQKLQCLKKRALRQKQRNSTNNKIRFFPKLIQKEPILTLR